MGYSLRKLWSHIQERCAPRKPRSAVLAVETLEDRSLLSGNVLQTNLVSDLPGVAQHLDAHLVNPWGISESPTSPFWVSDNNAGVATLYNSQGAPQSLVVNIPSPGDPTGNSGTPTGTVFNIDLAGNGFMISNGTTSAPAVFLFATEDGTIAGWAPSVDLTHAIIAVPNPANPSASDEAVYKGLAIATDANGRTLLYATNFHSGQIDVFDTNFKVVTTLPAGAFTDPHLPSGYAPFNVQVLGGKVYVTYALQDADKHDDVSGPHHGFVDAFNLDGTARQRLISRGPLDSPWGLAIAPSSFGSLAGALLVGNFGNGHINAFNVTTGAFLGALKDPDGETIQIDGLWALKVGNGGNGGDANTVYFTAGLFGETHGLFGSLTPVAQGSPEGPAEAQMVQADLDVVQIKLSIVLQDISTGVTGAALHQAIRDLDAALVRMIHDEIRFAADQAKDDHARKDDLEFDPEALKDVFAEFGRLGDDRR